MNFYHLRGLLMPLRFDLRGGLNTVGRNPTNDVVVHEASVSAFHAEISVDERGVIVRDLQSTNGTFIDDEPITEQEIRSGQVVQFGTVALRLEIDEIRILVPKPPSAPAGSPSQRSNPAHALMSVPATHRCLQCNRLHHESNLKKVRLHNESSDLLFCPLCSGRVEPLTEAPPAPKAKPGILARITQTIHLGRRKPRP
jgi:predicted component of type VI protein secretion system